MGKRCLCERREIDRWKNYDIIFMVAVMAGIVSHYINKWLDGDG